MYTLSMRRGFSVIEMLVTMSILVVLSSFLILYNRTGEAQILLLREQAHLISTVIRAKSLALNTLIEDVPACGYGVHIEVSTGVAVSRYFIYRDKAINCRTSDRIYAAASDEIVGDGVVTLPPQVVFGEVGVRDIMFVPPDPQVFLDGSQALTEADIVMMSVDGKTKATVTVNNAGQISQK
jgi:prepilin-type N-terminal cleavage/methylation domain-containing protein